MMEMSLHVIIRFATNSGADVQVIFRSRYQDTLSFTPVSSKHVLERLILAGFVKAGFVIAHSPTSSFILIYNSRTNPSSQTQVAKPK